MCHTKSYTSPFVSKITLVLALPILAILFGNGCSKYITEEELQDEINKNSAATAQAIHDSLSLVYSQLYNQNRVEVYVGGSSAGGAEYPPYVNTDAPYTGVHHYRSQQIPGGLNPGDKVFAVAEARFERVGTALSFGVTPQSIITVANNPNIHPSPSVGQSSNLQYVTSNQYETWSLQDKFYTIDRSGAYSHAQSAGTWSAAYVNLYARIYYDGMSLWPNGGFAVGGDRIDVIVVRK